MQNSGTNFARASWIVFSASIHFNERHRTEDVPQARRGEGQETLRSGRRPSVDLEVVVGVLGVCNNQLHEPSTQKLLQIFLKHLCGRAIAKLTWSTAQSYAALHHILVAEENRKFARRPDLGALNAPTSVHIPRHGVGHGREAVSISKYDLTEPQNPVIPRLAELNHEPVGFQERVNRQSSGDIDLQLEDVQVQSTLCQATAHIRLPHKVRNHLVSPMLKGEPGIARLPRAMTQGWKFARYEDTSSHTLQPAPLAIILPQQVNDPASRDPIPNSSPISWRMTRTSVSPVKSKSMFENRRCSKPARPDPFGTTKRNCRLECQKLKGARASL